MCLKLNTLVLLLKLPPLVDLHSLLTTVEPKGFFSASKRPEWLAAMNEEMSALNSNQTWELVPRPPDTNVVGSKWIFRTKYKADGSIERLKARLVAQGFTQIPGFDFHSTFSPVVKAATVRVVLSLSVMHSWPLHQLDVKNAFLNGYISETIYMEQPPGYVDSRFPNHVCRLKKALYGLKQAPRAWFHRLSTFLSSSGFACSRADTSLFVYHRGATLLYLLVYVDDIILTGNDSTLIRQFIGRLQATFAIKDLGKLSYFLGLEVAYTDDGLFLSQSKYANDILVRAELVECKPVSTPMVVGQHLTSTGSSFSDPPLFRSLVGALQYLTITRPDISFVVNTVSQFMQSPSIEHFYAVKRILRYIKGTATFGLRFTKSSVPTLLAYLDADWAACPDTRRSVSGHSAFVGSNIVLWSSKKQPTVSRSSCESEYRALANAAADIVWLTHLLSDLRVSLPSQPVLLCDNQGAIFIGGNPVSHKRAKHIELDYHFTRELVAAKKLVTQFVPSNLNVADIFTKSLSRPAFTFLRSKLCVMANPTLRLRGGVSDIMPQIILFIHSYLYCYYNSVVFLCLSS